jgi:hypothetical protein
MNVNVFYAGMLLIKIPVDEYSQWRRSMCHGDPEVYNGAFVYCHQPQQRGAVEKSFWYRMDGTPVLLSDVPKELHVLNLILQ